MGNGKSFAIELLWKAKVDQPHLKSTGKEAGSINPMWTWINDIFLPLQKIYCTVAILWQLHVISLSQWTLLWGSSCCCIVDTQIFIELLKSWELIDRRWHSNHCSGGFKICLVDMKDMIQIAEFVFSGLSIMLLSWEGIFLSDNLSSYVHMNGSKVCCSQHHHQHYSRLCWNRWAELRVGWWQLLSSWSHF